MESPLRLFTASSRFDLPPIPLSSFFPPLPNVLIFLQKWKLSINLMWLKYYQSFNFVSQDHPIWSKLYPEIREVHAVDIPPASNSPIPMGVSQKTVV